MSRVERSDIASATPQAPFTSPTRRRTLNCEGADGPCGSRAGTETQGDPESKPTLYASLDERQKRRFANELLNLVRERRR